MILYYSMKLGVKCNISLNKIEDVASKVGLHIHAGKTKLMQIGVLKAEKLAQSRLKVQK